MQQAVLFDNFPNFLGSLRNHPEDIYNNVSYMVLLNRVDMIDTLPKSIVINELKKNNMYLLKSVARSKFFRSFIKYAKMINPEITDKELYIMFTIQ